MWVAGIVRLLAMMVAFLMPLNCLLMRVNYLGPLASGPVFSRSLRLPLLLPLQRQLGLRRLPLL